MYSLIDNVEPTALTSNLPTVGYNSLLMVVANGASGADNYEGTKEEADALKAGMTIKVADTTAEDGEDIDAQYVSARTIAGTKTALVEIILTKAFVKTLNLGTNITASAKLYTTPLV